LNIRESKISRLLVLLSTIFIFSVIAFAQAPSWFKETVTKKRAGNGLKTSNEFVEDLWSAIYSISSKYEVPPTLIAAVISVESNFSNVKGSGGVLGMMQILPSTAKSISELLGLEVPKNGWDELLTNYRLNITYGTAYISYLYKKYGTFQKALEAYNNGKNKAAYAKLIIGQYDKYEKLHQKELSEKPQNNFASSEINEKQNTTSVEATDTSESVLSESSTTSNYTSIFGILYQNKPGN